MRKFPWSLALVAVAITGCTSFCGVKRGDLTPEQVVERYLDISLNMKQVSERDLLLDFCTGNLKSAIESSSDETIKAAFIDRQYKLDNYSVVERRDRTPRETEITFELTYYDLGSGSVKTEDAPKVMTENTVSVVRENNVWLIRDVLGNKTTIDFAVSEDSIIKAKPGPGKDEEEEQAPPPAP